MRVRHVLRGSAGLAAVGWVLAAQPSFAQQDDEPLDRTPQSCIVVNNISKTRVIDDQTIIFYMRGRRIYRNYLARECPGLEREDRFMYEARNNRLCDVDTITVMEDWGGRPTEFGRFGRGFTCRLGEFHPLSAEEAEAIELENRRGSRRDAIESRSVEVPPEAEADEAAADATTDAAAPTETRESD